MNAFFHILIRRCLFTCFLTAVLTFALLSCVKQKTPVPWPEKEWPTATPESQGLDSTVLAEGVRSIRRDNVNIHSILLIRNGYLVLEAYFYPYDGKNPHDVASVTKSVTATLVGQAVGDGTLPPLETPVMNIFSGSAWGKGWNGVTLENLITMSSGMQCGDPPLEETIFLIRKAPDWVEAIRAQSITERPGHQFDYCSPNFHLLSAAVTRVTGMPLEDFARERLFTPIGIERFDWPKDPQGISVGWGDLKLYARDMARIGYLYMNDGRWKDRQILPSGWVKAATKSRISTQDKDTDYGYGWWLAKGDYRGVYEARGRGGQGITVWPKTGIVFVTTGGGYDRDAVVNLLLPAVKSGDPLPENADAVRDLIQAVAEAALPPEPQQVGESPPRGASISGARFVLDANPLGLRAFSLTFREGRDVASLSVRMTGKRFLFPVGLDGLYRFSEDSPSGDPAAVRGRWESGDRFVIDYNEITRINRFRMEMTFSGSEVTLLYSEPTGQIAGKVRGKRP